MTDRLRPLLFCLALLVGWSGLRAAEALPFAELFELARTNLARIDAAQLNRWAVEGFLEKLGGLARFAEEVPEVEQPVELLPVATAHDGGHAYVRLGAVSGDVAVRLAAALEKLAATNQLKGVVLDLRFAAGRDFAAAARVADLFLPAGQPVLDWGERPFLSTAKTNPPSLPLAVLVNRATRGAAEAVAASLRRAGVALVLGGTTAGEASLYREFTLSDGRRLRLAVTPVRTGDGEAVPSAGVVPDIAVSVRPETERSYLADPFSGVASAPKSPGSSGGTNQIISAVRVRKKLTEADLVRARQEGRSVEAVIEGATNAPAPAEVPRLVRDPVLARALDLLKGLSVIRGR